MVILEMVVMFALLGLVLFGVSMIFGFKITRGVDLVKEYKRGYNRVLDDFVKSAQVAKHKNGSLNVDDLIHVQQTLKL